MDGDSEVQVVRVAVALCHFEVDVEVRGVAGGLIMEQAVDFMDFELTVLVATFGVLLDQFFVREGLLEGYLYRAFMYEWVGVLSR